MLVTGEQARAMGYNPDSMVSIGGKYEIGGTSSAGGLYGNAQEGMQAADRYINDLLSSYQGDKDFAIKQLKQEHDQAVGSNDIQRAQFLETVADQLEYKIGRIPYDYQVGVQRAEASQKTALQRLMEDEKTWMQERDVTNKEARTAQQEQLLQRGILSGTREAAQGLAGQEVGTLEDRMQRQLEAYQRAKGRTVADLGTQTTQTLEDLKTGARRGAIGAQTTLETGTEALNRRLESQKKELERLRAKEYDVVKQSVV